RSSIMAPYCLAIPSLAGTYRWVAASSAATAHCGQLLVQILANLVENVWRRTPSRCRCPIPRSQEACEKVFQPFYRLETSRSTPGSGLGLAIMAATRRLAPRSKLHTNPQFPPQSVRRRAADPDPPH